MSSNLSLLAKRREPVEALVETLREWLALAKSGDLRGVSLIGMVDYESEDGPEYRLYREGIDDMEAASMCEQMAFNIRAGIHATSTEPRPVQTEDDD